MGYSKHGFLYHYFNMANSNPQYLNFEQKHKEDLQRLRDFRLLDDDFMSKVFAQNLVFLLYYSL